MKLFASVAALSLLPLVAAAAPVPQALHFARGATSATVHGRVGAGTVAWTFSGREGQRVLVTVTNPGHHLAADVSGDGRTIPMGADDGNGRIDAPLPYTGPFRIQVWRERGRAVERGQAMVPFTMTVSITE